MQTQVLELDGIVYKICFKRMRSMRIKLLSPDVPVQVSVPMGTPEKLICAFIQQHSATITDSLSAMAAEVNANSLSQVDLFGKRYTIQKAQSNHTYTEICGNNLVVFSPTQLSESELRSLLIQWQRKKLEAILPSLAAQCQDLTGLCPVSWSVSEARTRFGSITVQTKKVHISRFIAAYPTDCIKAVMLHELTHLLHHGHTKEFYAQLKAFCPNTDYYDEILRSNKYIRIYKLD